MSPKAHMLGIEVFINTGLLQSHEVMRWDTYDEVSDFPSNYRPKLAYSFKSYSKKRPHNKAPPSWIHLPPEQ